MCRDAGIAAGDVQDAAVPFNFETVDVEIKGLDGDIPADEVLATMSGSAMAAR